MSSVFAEFFWLVEWDVKGFRTSTGSDLLFLMGLIKLKLYFPVIDPIIWLPSTSLFPPYKSFFLYYLHRNKLVLLSFLSRFQLAKNWLFHFSWNLHVLFPVSVTLRQRFPRDRSRGSSLSQRFKLFTKDFPYWQNSVNYSRIFFQP